ncbi:hypothetical protein NUSPORA_00714 [Nucleospora cyclopteri]
MYKTNDPLYDALQKHKKSSFSIPIASGKHFNSKINLEHFGLTYSQRFIAFTLCVIMGIVSFFYSLVNILFIITKPAKFAVPYAFSNLCFFISIGFIKGFRTYFRDLNASHKRIYSYTFLFSTVVTLYFASNSFYVTSLVIMFFQVISFICFAISFVPGGAQGLTSLIQMFLKGN